MAFFATPYTIHFDDTMAYGSHHFMTAFKFQCASREALLYGELIFDRPGVKDALESVFLFTADAYSRNLSPAYLGDRVAIFISLEEWGRVSTRFCYRMLGEKAQPICAGFQTIICADAKSGRPVPLPEPVRIAFDDIREIAEAESPVSFRERVLQGTESTQSLFSSDVCESALSYLSDRYPHPRIVETQKTNKPGGTPSRRSFETISNQIVADAPLPATPVVENEVWVFPGQGAFDAGLLCERIAECVRLTPELRDDLDQSASIVSKELGADGRGLLSGSVEDCVKAVRGNGALTQIAIFIQSVLGARLRQRHTLPTILMGHSFGELAAFCVGGCYDLTTGVRIVCQRVNAVDELGPESGSLLVAATSRRAVGEEISVCGLSDLRIAGRNHEKQTVVSGPDGQLEQLREQLKSFGIQSTSISSPTSFHHPSLQNASAVWFRQLDQLAISAPSRAIYSPIGRNVIAPGDNIAAILSSQFLRSFDLQGAIDDLVAGGTTRFVDCGSSGSLARLLKAAGPDSIEVLRVGDAVEDRAAAKSEATPFTTSRIQNGLAPQPIETTDRFTVETQASVVPSHKKSHRTSVAIVGQGCLLPGRATSPGELYSAIIHGRLGIVDQRKYDPDWGRDFYAAELTPDRSTSALVGRVDDRDIVSPSGVDSKVFDEFSRAQQVLCVSLVGCLPALQAANPKRVLCLVGATADGFSDQDKSAVLRFAGVDPSDGDVAKRIGDERSNLQDPYIAIQEVFDRIVSPGMDVQLIDAACASSLYSMALGMQALEDGEVDFVVAGGVFCPGPGNNCLFSQFGGLTATGCRPFDANADGVVFSEGAAFVVLQRLSDAKRSGASIGAVLRGVGLSSDGRSSSANVPQTSGQKLALERCYANYDVAPESIAAIEAHGTSTPVGDATELKTLNSFFSRHVDSPIPVHSLKGLLGHSGWAAGAASIISACEVIRHGVFPSQAFHTKSSEALSSASQVLTVAKEPTSIDLNGKCIAIDGFGFGGSNAHVVIEPLQEGLGGDQYGEVASGNVTRVTNEDDELVVVACHQLVPTSVEIDAAGRKRTRFDRDAHLLPDDMLLLPDLVDDMDVTQKLAISVVGETLKKISNFADVLRPQTGIVIAHSGKTERAVEATTRILAPRIKRELAGLAAADLAEQANLRARPSGPYTLQCMMPNVAAGRAALQFDLNGPNFVVDSGSKSLESAFTAAGRLLRSGEDSGSRLIVVAAISANRWAVPKTEAATIGSEYAAAFAVTTRSNAEKFGLKVVGPLESALVAMQSDATTEEKVTTLMRTFDSSVASLPVAITASKTVQATSDRTSSTADEFPIHTPVWVDAALNRASMETFTAGTSESWCILAEAQESLVAELVETIPEFSSRHLLLLVGPQAESEARRIARPNVIATDLQSEESAMAVINEIVQFNPDSVVAIGRAGTWDLGETLENVPHNDLCELLFLTMKNLTARIHRQETDVWGLFPGGWNEVVHPSTGAVSGLIKSVKRELPDGRLGVLSRRSPSVADAFRGLLRERRSPDNRDQEIVHDGNRRLLRRFRPSDAEPSVESDARFALSADSVVVASGGARGVTAVTIEALLRDYGCTVICLGRSPLEDGPPDFGSAEVQERFFADFVANNPGSSLHEMKKSYQSALARWEAKETMDRLSLLGGRVRYVAVDVTDVQAVEDTIDRVVAEFGRIDLVIHGAGVQWSKRLEDRTLAEFRKTFDVKVAGLRNLLASCRSRLGRLVQAITFSSAYSIFGNDGQHDYGAANETMDRLCGMSRLLSDHHWASIAWSAWDGIGMTRGSEYRALAEQRNLALLDAAGGQRIFRDIIQGIGAEINLPLSVAERSRYRLRTVPASGDRSVLGTSELSLRLLGLECLDHHLARGMRTLPGAWIINYMTEAVLTHSGQSAEFVGVKGMQFSRFIRLTSERDPNLRIVIDATSDGFDVSMIGDILNPDGIALATDVVFASATLSIIRQSLGSAMVDQISPHGKSDVKMVSDPYCADGQIVSLSGPFDCLPEIEIGTLGRQAVFAPSRSVQWQGVVPSLLLDASFRVACMRATDGLHVPTTIDNAIIPVGIAADSTEASGWRIRATRPIVTGDNIRCERIEVTDESGAVRMRAEGALVTRLWE